MVEQNLNSPQIDSKVWPVWKQSRLKAFEVLKSLKTPSRNDEAWKYTSLKSLPVLNLPSVPNSASVQKPQEAWTGLDFVFVNGQLSEKLSSAFDQKGLRLVPLAKAVTQKEYQRSLNRFRKQRAIVKGLRTDYFTQMNMAYAENGFLLQVAPNQSISQPLRILFLNESAATTQIRLFVEVGSRASLQIFEQHQGESQSLNNVTTETILHSGSKCEWVKWQAEGLQSTHIARSHFFVKKGATLKTLSASSGAKVSRHQEDAYLLGPEAFVRMAGFGMVSGEQQLSQYTLIDHVVGGAVSDQLYKNLLGGNSRCAFDGMVRIRLDAQKASSQQLNQNLLLTSGAEADSKPQLEILADDVKATHGSTVGQLSEDELFYLESRAISRSEAVQMLSLGFVRELIEQIDSDSIRAYLDRQTQKAYSKMNGGNND